EYVIDPSWGIQLDDGSLMAPGSCIERNSDVYCPPDQNCPNYTETTCLPGTLAPIPPVPVRGAGWPIAAGLAVLGLAILARDQSRRTATVAGLSCVILTAEEPALAVSNGAFPRCDYNIPYFLLDGDREDFWVGADIDAFWANPPANWHFDYGMYQV